MSALITRNVILTIISVVITSTMLIPTLQLFTMFNYEGIFCTFNMIFHCSSYLFLYILWTLRIFLAESKRYIFSITPLIRFKSRWSVSNSSFHVLFLSTVVSNRRVTLTNLHCFSFFSSLLSYSFSESPNASTLI